MKTKIGLPLGLALVMFIAVFTTMLALGALNPRPVGAAVTSLTVERSNDDVGFLADWTFTATNDGTALTGVTEISIDLGNIDADNATVETAAQWSVVVAGNDPITPSTVDVANTDEVTITIASTDVAANATVVIKFVPVKNADGTPIATLGIENPVAGPNTIGVSIPSTVVNAVEAVITTFAEGATIADDPPLMVTRTDNRVGAYATWTITGENDGDRIAANDTIAIVFTGQDVGADCDVGDDTTTVCTESNWELTPDTTIADPASAAPTSVSVDADTKTVRIVVSADIEAEAAFEIEFAPDSDMDMPGIQNSATAMTSAIMVAGQSVDLATTEDVLLDVSVTADPTSPGAAAEYTITFKTEAELEAGTAQIILDIDSSVGVPTSLAPSAVRIRASRITTETEGEGGPVANQNRPLDLAPVYRVIPGTDGRKEYKIRIPNMDGVPENPVASIPAGAIITLTLLSNSGFTNPTESNVVVFEEDGVTRDSGGDDFKVSTTKQTGGSAPIFQPRWRSSPTTRPTTGTSLSPSPGRGSRTGPPR